MQKNQLLIVIAILSLGIFGVFYFRQSSLTNNENLDGYETSIKEEDVEDVIESYVNEETVINDIESMPESSNVKEFAIDSFYDDKGVWFSLKEINVNKGDTVKIKVKNIKGMHDFVIDEYNVKVETPLNEEVMIEFVADKAGEFVYYCSVPGHKEKGQWGTLKVSE